MAVVDTSVAIPAVRRGTSGARVVLELRVASQTSNAGHASIETYSVLTRLPVPARLTSDEAQALLRSNFPEVVWPPATELTTFLERCGDRGITAAPSTTRSSPSR